MISIIIGFNNLILDVSKLIIGIAFFLFIFEKLFNYWEEWNKIINPNENTKVKKIYIGKYDIKILGLNKIFTHDAICIETEKGLKYWYEIAGHGGFDKKPNQILGPTYETIRKNKMGSFKTRINSSIIEENSTKISYDYVNGKKQFSLNNIKFQKELQNMISINDIENFNKEWLIKHKYYSLGLLNQDEANCQHYVRDFLKKFCNIEIKTQSEKINTGLKIAAIGSAILSTVSAFNAYRRSSSDDNSSDDDN